MKRRAGPSASSVVIPSSDGGKEPAEGVRQQRSQQLSHVRRLLAKYGLIGVWAVMALGFLVARPHSFGTLAAVQAIFGSQETLVFLSIAALCGLVVGEFDLSIAFVMGLSATIIPVLAGQHHVNVALACVIALSICAAWGALNAFIVIVVQVPSLVVTLGSGTLALGIAEFISNTSAVSLNDDSFTKVSGYSVAGMPVSFWYGLAAVAVFAYVIGWTPLGRHILFVGANREVARLAGIRVDRIRGGSYIAAALLAGFSGLLLISTNGGFDPTESGGYLLPAIAAVFLGTAVVQPGQFNPVGTIIGIYFLETGIFGLQLLGLSTWIQDVFYGGGLVVAVSVATVIRRRATLSSQ